MVIMTVGVGMWYVISRYVLTKKLRLCSSSRNHFLNPASDAQLRFHRRVDVVSLRNETSIQRRLDCRNNEQAGIVDPMKIFRSAQRTITSDHLLSIMPVLGRAYRVQAVVQNLKLPKAHAFVKLES